MTHPCSPTPSASSCPHRGGWDGSARSARTAVRRSGRSRSCSTRRPAPSMSPASETRRRRSGANVAREEKVAFVVDDTGPAGSWSPRVVEIRGGGRGAAGRSARRHLPRCGARGDPDPPAARALGETSTGRGRVAAASDPVGCGMFGSVDIARQGEADPDRDDDQVGCPWSRVRPRSVDLDVGSASGQCGLRHLHTSAQEPSWSTSTPRCPRPSATPGPLCGR